MFLQSVKYFKTLGLKKFFYLPHLFSPQEKRRMIFFVLLGALAGGILIARVYTRITVPIPAVGGSYTEGMLREPHIINPVLAVNDADRDMARLVFSGLITYTGNGKIEYDLAQNLEISNDGKTYTIFLRKDAFWHDGKPVTADDVLFTIKTIQNPNYRSTLRPNWQGVTVEKIDEATVKFILRTPYAPFIENLTVGIIPKHLWETVGPEQASLHELNLKPVGSGPYKFYKLDKDKDGSLVRLELRRNANYYRDGPYLKKIIFIFFKNEEAMLKALRLGEIEGTAALSNIKLADLDHTRFSIRTLFVPRIFGIFINERNFKPLADKKVREAIGRAINKRAIAENVVGGALVSELPLPLTSESSEENLYPYDLEKARSLLEEAGWKDENGDGLREKTFLEKGKNVTLPLRITLSTSDWPDLLKTAETLKSMLKEVGIELVIDARPFADLETSIIRPRNFQLLLFGQVYGYELDPFPFWHSSQIKDPGLNISFYANKKADEILETARRIADPAERNQKYSEFSKLITKDIPAIFLYSQLYLYLVPKDILGGEITKISLSADRFNDVNKWYRKTKRVLK